MSLEQAELNPVDAADEEFVIGGENADGQKSKYDFEGNFAVELTGIAYGPAKSSGNMIYTVTMVGQEGPATGLVFTDYQPEWKTAEMLKLFGIKKGEDGLLRFSKGKVLGQTVVAKFKREEYNGKWSAKVQGYQSVNHTTAPASTDDIPF
jgi:hypothetical protein